jgi:hypothetical protein
MNFFLLISLLVVAGALLIYNARSAQLHKQRSRSAGQYYIPILPSSGDAIYVEKRSNDTNNEYVKLGLIHIYDGPCGNNPTSAEPLKRPCTPPLHYHLKQSERFDVIKGEIGYMLNGKTATLKVSIVGDFILTGRLVNQLKYLL